VGSFLEKGKIMSNSGLHRFDRIASDCYPCVLNQARSASRFAGLNDTQTHRILNTAEEWLRRSQTEPLLVQHIVRHIADAVIQESGQPPDFDIYADVKEKSNTLSMAHIGSLERRLAASDSPLDMGLQIAAAGNIIDFGAKNHGSIDMEQEINRLTEAVFARYDITPLREQLAAGTTLLYLCDNCGEIVFDMMFMKVLQRIYPSLNITAAVRERPIINDATLADAQSVGLDNVVTTISSGSVYPGTVMTETSGPFQRLFAAADVIISKGQGNFETLLPDADGRLFFLLRIKCEYMASLSGVHKDSLVLMQGGARDVLH